MVVTYDPAFNFDKTIRRSVRRAVVRTRRGAMPVWKRKQMNRRRRYRFKINQAIKSVEKKHNDSLVEAQSVSSTPVITQINQISQGDDVVQREGNYIWMQSIFIRITLNVAGDDSNALRWMLIYDNQTNKTAGVVNAPAIADILQEVGTSVQQMVSFMNWDNRMRFRILASGYLVVDADDPYTELSRYIKINKPTRFGGSGGTNVSQGALWLVYFSDSTAATHPTVTIKSRLTFTS